MSTVTTWGLVVETTMGSGERKHTEAHVVAHVTGSRSEALAELERRARNHVPMHPLSPKRRRLLRAGDGFLLVVDGAWQSFVTRFTLAELLEDSAAPPPPNPWSRHRSRRRSPLPLPRVSRRSSGSSRPSSWTRTACRCGRPGWAAPTWRETVRRPVRPGRGLSFGSGRTRGVRPDPNERPQPSNFR